MTKRSGPRGKDRLSGAFCDLAGGNEFGLLGRYETRLHNMFQRSMKNLILLRQVAPQEPNEPETEIPNEPKSQESESSAPSPNEPNSEMPNEPRSASDPLESATSTEIAPLPNEPRPEEPSPAESSSDDADQEETGEDEERR